MNNTPSSRNSNYIIAKADSGASKNYWRDIDKKVLTNLTPCDGPSVMLQKNQY